MWYAISDNQRLVFTSQYLSRDGAVASSGECARLPPMRPGCSECFVLTSMQWSDARHENIGDRYPEGKLGWEYRRNLGSLLDFPRSFSFPVVILAISLSTSIEFIRTKVMIRNKAIERKGIQRFSCSQCSPYT